MSKLYWMALIYGMLGIPNWHNTGTGPGIEPEPPRRKVNRLYAVVPDQDAQKVDETMAYEGTSPVTSGYPSRKPFQPKARWHQPVEAVPAEPKALTGVESKPLIAGSAASQGQAKRPGSPGVAQDSISPLTSLAKPNAGPSRISSSNATASRPAPARPSTAQAGLAGPGNTKTSASPLPASHPNRTSGDPLPNSSNAAAISAVPKATPAGAAPQPLPNSPDLPKTAAARPAGAPSAAPSAGTPAPAIASASPANIGANKAPALTQSSPAPAVAPSAGTPAPAIAAASPANIGTAKAPALTQPSAAPVVAPSAGTPAPAITSASPANIGANKAPALTQPSAAPVPAAVFPGIFPPATSADSKGLPDKPTRIQPSPAAPPSPVTPAPAAFTPTVAVRPSSGSPIATLSSAPAPSKTAPAVASANVATKPVAKADNAGSQVAISEKASSLPRVFSPANPYGEGPRPRWTMPTQTAPVVEVKVAEAPAPSTSAVARPSVVAPRDATSVVAPANAGSSKFTMAAFAPLEQLAKQTEGRFYSSLEKPLAQTLNQVIRENLEQRSDVVFVLDHTSSMTNDVTQLRRDIKATIAMLSTKPDVHMGMATYSDVKNSGEFGYRMHDLTRDYMALSRFLDETSLYGSIEDVYGAVHATADGFAWRDQSKRMIIVLGDEPPAEFPESNHSAASVVAKCKENAIDANLYPVLIPKY